MASGYVGKTVERQVAALRARAEELTDDNHHSTAQMFEDLAHALEIGRIKTLDDMVKVLVYREWR